MAQNLWDYNPSDLFIDIRGMFEPLQRAYRGLLRGDQPIYPTPTGEPLERERVLPDDPFITWDYKQKQGEYEREDRLNRLRAKAARSGMPVSDIIPPEPTGYDLPMPEVMDLAPEMMDLPLPGSMEMPSVSEDSKLALRMARELAEESEGMFQIPTITATRGASGRLPTRDERIRATYGQDVDLERDMLERGFQDVGESRMEMPPVEEPYPRTYDMEPEWLRNAKRIREQNIVERGQWQGSDEELARKRLMELAGY